MTLLVLSCDVFFFKQKTAYEMRISDWSSDVCSSDLPVRPDRPQHGFGLELGQDHVLGAEIPGPQQHRIATDMAEGHHAQARIGARPAIQQIGRAHVCTPVTNAHLVCRLLLEKKKHTYINLILNLSYSTTYTQHTITHLPQS